MPAGVGQANSARRVTRRLRCHHPAFLPPSRKAPAFAPTLALLRKELHQLLNKCWEKLRATVRAERWEEVWCSRLLRHRRLATPSDTLTAVANPETGRITTNPKEVTAAERSFYEALYTSEASDAAAFPLQGPETMLSIDETWVTEEELSAAHQLTKPNRNPGMDDLLQETMATSEKAFDQPVQSFTGEGRVDENHE